MDALAKALQMALYTFTYSNNTPSDFCRVCGGRSGLVGPKGNAATKRLLIDRFLLEKDIKKLIAGETGKLIVIDNADILLDDDTRKYISLDDKNQYLIIGRNPKNLFATSDNLFELVSEKIGEQTEFRLKKYL